MVRVSQVLNVHASPLPILKRCTSCRTNIHFPKKWYNNDVNANPSVGITHTHTKIRILEFYLDTSSWEHSLSV